MVIAEMLVLADLLLYFHFLYVLGVILPVPLILVGRFMGWEWVRNLYFRGVHVGMILVVVVNSAMGNYCPLSELEWSLREQASSPHAFALPLAEQLSGILYYDLPLWGFTILYAVFGGLVITVWIWIPPRLSR